LTTIFECKENGNIGSSIDKNKLEKLRKNGLTDTKGSESWRPKEILVPGA
jgi:hypothetical protein